MEIIRAPITIEELREKHMHFFKSIVKAVVDIKRKVVAVDGELHSDLEKLLLEVGSSQDDLWGINIYPFKDRDNFIEYSALINIRPHQDNFSMEVEDLTIRKKIEDIVKTLIRE
ncbi:MAG: hypothetical protein DRP68_04775 [Candidatus Omnitrophota bacterium]|nr:MAG: hypothetical protein DRP68_04775 [Candidatus Omnitrophota bacterium]RKY44614.1 MAG: hypothetical protein DRP81_05275 [Candidatus Omnitrophota bacterium]